MVTCEISFLVKKMYGFPPMLQITDHLIKLDFKDYPNDFEIKDKIIKTNNYSYLDTENIWVSRCVQIIRKEINNEEIDFEF